MQVLDESPATGCRVPLTTLVCGGEGLGASSLFSQSFSFISYRAEVIMGLSLLVATRLVCHRIHKAWREFSTHAAKQGLSLQPWAGTEGRGQPLSQACSFWVGVGLRGLHWLNLPSTPSPLPFLSSQQKSKEPALQPCQAECLSCHWIVC